MTVGNRCDGSPGEAGQLTTAGIELGADVWFPRIERFRRGEVVVVEHQGFGPPEEVIGDGRAGARLVEHDIGGLLDEMITEVASPAGESGMDALGKKRRVVAHLPQQIIDRERVVADGIAWTQGRREVMDPHPVSPVDRPRSSRYPRRF